MEKLVKVLYDDFPHLFDDHGIDHNAYDDYVKFRDPITKHDTIDGYLFNIEATGPYEITTRWTMVMKFDYWDSTQNNDYFSLEGLVDVIKQLRIYETPDLETPSYQIIRRTVRKYESFIVVETEGDNLAGNRGFNDVTWYIFGKNATTEKIPMTTTVFTQAFDAEKSKVSIQIFLPDKSLSSGKPTDDVVREKEKQLRSSLIRDGLKPHSGCMLARYNDPGLTWTCSMRYVYLEWHRLDVGVIRIP
ncbi:unnamed protein product [Withania somnifera]